MLHLVLGRIGSGKTTYVRNLLADLAKSGMDKMVMIVPEQYSFESEKAMLEMLGPKDAEKVEVLSFTRLAHRVFNEYAISQRTTLDDAGRAVFMSIALESLKDKLDVYKKQVNSIALVGEMLRISAEFKQCSITPKKLFIACENMPESVLKRKINEISLILTTYEALIVQSYMDNHDSLDLLFETLLDHKFFEGKFVVLDAFKGFTTQELNIISQILVQAKATYVTLCADTLHDNQNGIGVFSCVKRTARKLIELANRNNVRVTKPLRLSGESKFNNFPYNITRFNNSALIALEAGIFNPTATPYSLPAPEITLCAAQDIVSECDFVAHTAKRLLREEGLRCRDMAIIARNVDRYKGEIEAALKKYDIPVFEDKRQPIITQPLIALVRAALETINNSFQTDSIMRYLKCGLTDMKIEEISVLENYALIWQINGSRWFEDWTAHPDGFGSELDETAKETLAEINKLRWRAVTPLKNFRDACKDTDGEGIAKAIFELLSEIHAGENLKKLAIEFENKEEPELAKEQERVWDLLMDILDLSASTLKDTFVSPQRYGDLFDIIISKQDMGTIPQGIDEITIGSADRIRTSSPKVVFVVGANEDVFPLSCVSKGLISDADRRKLIELGIEVSEPCEYKAVEERFIAYNALCSASDRVYVSYALKNATGEEQSPSVIVSQIKRLFPKCNMIDTANLPELDYIEGEKPAFEYMAKSFRDNTVMSATLKEHFSKKEECADRIAALNRVVSEEPIAFQDKEKSQALFGKELYISASRVEEYNKCPFKYFCKYGLNAKPRTIAELNPMISGTLVHYVLENLIAEFGGKGLAEYNADLIYSQINKLLYEYLNEKMGGMEDKPKRFDYLFNRLARMLKEIVDRMIIEFSQSEFEPVDFELRIDVDGEIPPYELEFPDGGTLKLRGSVDRVDCFEKDGKSYIRVIDYKSGGKNFVLSDVLCGLNMQMLLYLITIWHNGKEKYGEVVPAGVLYMPANASFSQLDRRASEDEIQKEKLKLGKMNGIVLSDEDVIHAMDKDGKGKFIPVTMKANGSISGSLISLEQLGKLNKEIDSILIEMGQKLHKGKVEAIPIYGADYPNICAWCDYNCVCGHEQDSPVFEINKYKHNETLELLNGGENNE